jgi:mono/diheme cytochrome c family protein
LRRFSNPLLLAVMVGQFLILDVPSASALPQSTDASDSLLLELNDADEVIRRNCVSCHSAAESNGGLNLESLSRQLDDAATLHKWVRVHDRIAAGEMPPPDADLLKPAERSRMLEPLARSLKQAHATVKGQSLRRLNRAEYSNIVNDLFGTHMDLAAMLPSDGRSHEFDNVGSALSISPMQMQRYLEAITAVLDNAIATTLAPPGKVVVRASYVDTRGGEQFLGSKWLKRDDGAVVFFRQWGYPTGMLRETNVRLSGRYKVRVTGYAFQSKPPVTFSIGATTFARGLEQPTFGYFQLPPGEPTTVEIEQWIDANYMIQVEPWGLNDRYAIKNHGLENYRGPGLAIQHIEVEGPLTDEFPSLGHRLVFDGLKRDEIPPRNPAERDRRNYRPRFRLLIENPETEFDPVLHRVVTAAFRRPVNEDDITPYRRLLLDEIRGGADFETALRTAVSAVFCSPSFLFHNRNVVGQTNRLDDFSLATRLSSFLNRTSPDSLLWNAASSGQLAAENDATVLRSHAERLLSDENHERFLRDFTDAWLNLREIDFTNPDAVLYPEFDAFLKHSMLDESCEYLRELIRSNLSVTHLVKSDFAMLNNRLAEHYDIDEVEGPELRKVPLPTDSVRGGILSQGAVLKVSANGTNTSPVVRGVYVMDRILAKAPPPPPPGISGVEPDIRGSTTLRELLEKHRSGETCRACHQEIDPPGFALESFDPIGGWQDRFRSLGDGDRVDREIGGNRVRYRLGPQVDSSGELPDSRTFAGYVEFREHLAADASTLARAFVTKLLTFATGRDMGFSDREEIDAIVQNCEAGNFGVRDLILECIGSRIFREL